MGSSSPKEKKIDIIEEKIKERKKDKNEDEIEDTKGIEEINIIVDKSQTDLLNEERIKKEIEEKRKEEEEKKKEEEERKKEEFKQNVLKKIKQEEIIIKIKFTNEEFTNYIIKFFEEFIQVYNSIQKKNSFIPLISDFNKKYIYSFNNIDYPENPLKESFFEVLKYSTIIVVCLILMRKFIFLYLKLVLEMILLSIMKIWKMLI